ncbi:MAG: chemotaxis protein CheD [Peptococcaceae bacterium]|nr:chemotaxis protein CheD [Peptococcaceae bacterium]
MNTLIVGMADYKICKVPDSLMTIGLGSCLGVCVYDQMSKVAGMAHIMLPSSRDILENNPLKYADTCLQAMLEDIKKSGGVPSRLKAKMAGGAQMFSFGGGTSTMHIGENNTQAVTKELKKYGIPIIAQDVGGNAGRTITFDIETADLHIKTVKAGGKVI